MFTIIGADGNQYGPVSADKLREWIAAGRANAQTQVQRQGDTAWSTLGSLPEFAGSFGAARPSGAAPAAAAPAPVTQGQQVNAKEFAESLRAQGSNISLFDCLSRSFKLWTSNFLPLVGVTALIVIIQMVIGAIPLIGFLSGLFLNGVFYGGLYYYYLGKARGEPREVGDAFAGFSRALGPLVLTNLLQTGIIIGCTLVFLAPWLGVLVPLAISGGEPADMPALTGGLLVFTVLGGLIILYLSISWIFGFILVIDKGLGPWTALTVSWRVTTRHWFAVFFLVLFAAILSMLGLIALFVGVLLTLPIIFGAVIYAYESLFNPGSPALDPA